MTTSPKPKVLVVGSIKNAPKKYEELKKIIDFTEMDQMSHADAAAAFTKIIESDGPFIACILALNFSLPMPYPLSQPSFDPLLLSGCRFFSGPGAGYDRIDTAYLTSHSAVYANNPTAVGVRTADSTAMMILQALRGTTEQERFMRTRNEGKGGFMDRTLRAVDARKAVLGVVGMGNIGRMVSLHMQHFGMKVVYNKRSKLSEEEAAGATFVSLDELYAQSDVICIMCPLTDETRGMINKESIAKMKDEVILVNTARGPIMVEDDVLDALDSGKILRIALDVYANEPNPSQRILDSKRSVLQPHSAWYNETMAVDSQVELLENLEAFVVTGKAKTPVN